MSTLPRGSVGKAATALLAIILGAVVLYLGLPRTIAAFALLPGNQTLRLIQNGEAAKREKLEALAASRRRALAWVDSGRMWSDLALAQLLLAEPRNGGGKPRQELVDQALTSLDLALRAAPANPHAWTRRAYADLLTRGPSRSVSAALAMSILTARYEPDLMFPRLELSLGAWPYFPLHDRDLVLGQVRLAWRRSPVRLADIAQRTGQVAVIRAALAATPADLAAFERRLR